MTNIENLKREKWTLVFMMLVCVFLLYVRDEEVLSQSDVFLMMLGACFISRFDRISLKIEILKELQKVKIQSDTPKG